MHIEAVSYLKKPPLLSVGVVEVDCVRDEQLLSDDLDAERRVCNL
jgi:hypothetical protein